VYAVAGPSPCLEVFEPGIKALVVPNHARKPLSLEIVFAMVRTKRAALRYCKLILDYRVQRRTTRGSLNSYI
jgi:hypothetical protein